MALLGNGSSDYATADDSAISVSSWSMTLWFKIYNSGTYQSSTTLVSRYAPGADPYHGLVFSNGAGDWGADLYWGTPPSTDYSPTGTIFQYNKWYFLAFTKTGNTLHLYYGDESTSCSEISLGDTSAGENPVADNFTFWAVHTYGSSYGAFGNLAVAAVKLWNNLVLTSGECETERLYYAPQKSGCSRNWKMNGVDVSACMIDALGNGNLTNGGTFSVVTGPSGVQDAGGGGTPGTIWPTITL